eukprot:SAG31_NODE_273_length_18667_cov_3.603619_7_plen_122_part_00
MWICVGQQLLLAAGADPLLADTQGATPISIVKNEREQSQKKSFEEWQENGVRPDGRASAPAFPSFTRVLDRSKRRRKMNKSKQQRRLEREWEADRHRKEELRRMAESIGSPRDTDKEMHWH